MANEILEEEHRVIKQLLTKLNIAFKKLEKSEVSPIRVYGELGGVRVWAVHLKHQDMPIRSTTFFTGMPSSSWLLDDASFL